MLLQLGFDESSVSWIDRRQNRWRAASHGDMQAAMYQSVYHFKADVSRADDDGGLGLVLFQKAMHGEAVSHGVEGEYARQIDTFDPGPDGPGTRADEQLVVRQITAAAVCAAYRYGPAKGINAFCRVVWHQLNAGKLGAMRQGTPVRSLATQEERQSANAVIRVFVGEHKRDFACRIEFMRAQSRADAGIATTDDKEAHVSILSAVDYSFVNISLFRTGDAAPPNASPANPLAFPD